MAKRSNMGIFDIYVDEEHFLFVSTDGEKEHRDILLCLEQRVYPNRRLQKLFDTAPTEFQCLQKVKYISDLSNLYIKYITKNAEDIRNAAWLVSDISSPLPANIKKYTRNKDLLPKDIEFISSLSSRREKRYPNGSNRRYEHRGLFALVSKSGKHYLFRATNGPQKRDHILKVLSYNSHPCKSLQADYSVDGANSLQFISLQKVPREQTLRDAEEQYLLLHSDIVSEGSLINITGNGMEGYTYEVSTDFLETSHIPIRRYIYETEVAEETP